MTEQLEPKANFAKKERVDVPQRILNELEVKIPPIFYWEDVVDGKSVKMTMAFKWRGQCYGMSYPIEDDNVVKRDIMRKKVFAIVKEALDVLVHHGLKVLDSNGIIDPRLVNDEEAIRWKLDPYWAKKVAAFNQLVRVAPITKKQAIALGLGLIEKVYA